MGGVWWPVAGHKSASAQRRRSEPDYFLDELTCFRRAAELLALRCMRLPAACCSLPGLYSVPVTGLGQVVVVVVVLPSLVPSSMARWQRQFRLASLLLVRGNRGPRAAVMPGAVTGVETPRLRAVATMIGIVIAI